MSASGPAREQGPVAGKGNSQVRGILLANILFQDAGVDVGRLQGTADVMAYRTGGTGLGAAPHSPPKLMPSPPCLRRLKPTSLLLSICIQGSFSVHPPTPLQETTSPSPQVHLQASRRWAALQHRSGDRETPVVPLHSFPAVWQAQGPLAHQYFKSLVPRFFKVP
jgi:hypothetical protein